MTPAVLVVRSGAAGAFPSPRPGAGFELTDKVTHKIVPVSPDLSELDEPADLAVFTSRVGVRRFFEEPALEAGLRRALAAKSGRIAAVGEGTADALRDRGIVPDIVGGGSGETLLRTLPEWLAGWRILLPRGEDGTAEVPEELHRRGAAVAPLLLYRKNPLPPDGALDVRVARGEFSAFAATSPSAAAWLFGSSTAVSRARLRETPAVVLGRFTRRYLESHDVARIHVAREASFQALLDMLGEVALAESPSAGIDSPA
ncbi:MAG TPA: uroporphyrinogen-III synthase [Thermoanaerobaculia bacterium]